MTVFFEFGGAPGWINRNDGSIVKLPRELLVGVLKRVVRFVRGEEMFGMYLETSYRRVVFGPAGTRSR